MRTNNPSLRLSDPTELGPRKQVNVKLTRRSALEKPETYWVELSVFQQENPDADISKLDLIWEEVEPGVWQQGVALLEI